MTIERVLLHGLSLLLVAAPLPFGSVQTEAAAVLSACSLLLGVAWVTWRSRRGLPALPWKDPVLFAGALFALVGVAQIVPLPRLLLEEISPGAVELRDQYEPLVSSPSGARDASDGSDGPKRYTGWRPVSLHPWATRQSTLRFLACLMAVLITIDLAARESCRRRLAMALVASGGFQAGYGLFEHFSGRQHIFGYAKRYYTDVATGTFVNRNHFAGYLEMTLPLAIALAAMAFSGLRAGRGAIVSARREGAPGRETFTAALFMIVALTMAVALVCSESRMGIASTFFALLAVGTFLAWRGHGKGFAAAAVIVTGATLLLLSQGNPSPLVDRFLRAADELRGGLGRWTIWTQAAGMVREFPLLGVGLGAFRYVFPAYRSTGAGTSLPHAHNDYLQVAAETGLAGCVVVVVGILLVAGFAHRRSTGRPDFGYLGQAAVAGVLAMALHSLTDFNLAIPSNALTLAILSGILICWVRIPAPTLALDQPANRPWLRTAAVPATLMIAVTVLAIGPAAAGVSAENSQKGMAVATSLLPPQAERADSILGSLDPGNAIRLFEAAARIAGGATRDLQVLFRAQESGVVPSAAAAAYVESRLDAAIRLQAAGLRHMPTSSRGHLEMGRFKAARCAAAALGGLIQPDCVAVAMPEFGAALRLNPMSAATHAGVARFLLANWPVLGALQRDEAAPIVERAAAFNREDRDLQRAWMSIRE